MNLLKVNVFICLIITCLAFGCTKQHVDPQADGTLSSNVEPVKGPLADNAKFLYVLTNKTHIYAINSLTNKPSVKKIFSSTLLDGQIRCLYQDINGQIGILNSNILFGTNHSGGGLGRGIYSINSEGANKKLITTTDFPVLKITTDRNNNTIYWIEEITKSPIVRRVMMRDSNGIVKQVQDAINEGGINASYPAAIEFDEISERLLIYYQGGTTDKNTIKSYDINGKFIANVGAEWEALHMRPSKDGKTFYGGQGKFFKQDNPTMALPASITLFELSDASILGAAVDVFANKIYLLTSFNASSVKVYATSLSDGIKNKKVADMQLIATIPGRGNQLEGRFTFN